MMTCLFGRSILKTVATACSKRQRRIQHFHPKTNDNTHRDRLLYSFQIHNHSYGDSLTTWLSSTSSSLSNSCSSYYTTVKREFGTQNYSDAEKSTDFPHLQSPTPEDAEELFLRMGSRPRSILTTFNITNDNDNNISDNHSDSDGYQETQLLLEKYNVDWTGHYRGFSSIVVRPESTKEVSRILSYCHKRRIGVVPQGGNTGLVGGSVGIGVEVILSLEKMNNIEHYDDNGNNIDKDDGSVIRADAGCILQDLQDYATEIGSLIPVDLGAKGSCQIGGNISTNAGGVYYYRYGSLHANVLGIEVVTPCGDILNLGYDPVSHLKDNTGYDLKHLFIGGEGTLGVVTKVSLRCPPLPTSVGAIWLTCTSLRDVVQVLTLARTKHLNEIVAAFEFMDRDVLELVRATHPLIRLPLDNGNAALATSDNIIEPYSILVETHGSNHNHDQEKLESFLECIMEKGLVVNGVMAQNLGQIEDFWKIRELCNPATAATGYVYKYDISLAASDFDSFIQDIKIRLLNVLHKRQNASSNDNLLCVNWGHIIDGNLHCNIVSPNSFERENDLLEYIDEGIFEEVAKRNGSISAEHGLGQYKNKYMSRIKNTSTLQTMHNIKKLFDPHGIMNPGKYLPLQAPE